MEDKSNFWMRRTRNGKPTLSSKTNQELRPPIISNTPIHDLQIWNSFEVANITSHQGTAIFQHDRGDAHIIAGNSKFETLDLFEANNGRHRERQDSNLSQRLNRVGQTLISECKLIALLASSQKRVPTGKLLFNADNGSGNIRSTTALDRVL